MAAPMADLSKVRFLTFDVFGTILDLGGSLTPFLADFLDRKGTKVTAAEAWASYRYRQRIEQYQDNIMALGHAGYLDSARRALMYVLRAAKVPFDDAEIAELMRGWQQLKPFPDALDGLCRLEKGYKLVVLSNGEPEFLDHLVRNRIGRPFDAVLSVSQVGAFKPHPGVYRLAMRELQAEPAELMMVSSNSFDVMGARSCGLRGAYVDRYALPYEETPFQPDLVVPDFTELADRLGA
jgi:2-haloacid dehalogenase